MELEQRQYPIGKLNFKKKYSEKEIERMIKIMVTYPAKYKRLTKKLTSTELGKSYREGGWTIQQILVHISDMHILHFARFKQALTVDNPIGAAGSINGWNALAEVNSVPVADSLALLEATHKRWVHLMRSMKMEDFNRTFHHPLRKVDFTLAQALYMGSWHVRHHLEHIKIALGS
jgi:DinB superfamily